MLDKTIQTTLMVRDFVLALDVCVKCGHMAPGESQEYDDARDNCHYLWAMMNDAQQAQADAAFSAYVTREGS